MLLIDRQDYSHSSDMGIRGNGNFKVGFYANFNVQNIAQEWVEESKRLLYLRTINNIKKSIYNGTTPLRAGSLHELAEDHKGLYSRPLHNLRDHVSSMSIVNRCDSTEAVRHRMIKQPAASGPDGVSVVNNSVKQLSVPSVSEVETPWLDSSLSDDSLLATESALELDDKAYDGHKKEHKVIAKKMISSLPATESLSKESVNARKALAGIYNKVMIVDNIESARNVVQLLTTKYKSFIHACDTEVE
jgi:DNA polymerase I